MSGSWSPGWGGAPGALDGVGDLRIVLLSTGHVLARVHSHAQVNSTTGAEPCGRGPHPAGSWALHKALPECSSSWYSHFWAGMWPREGTGLGGCHSLACLSLPLQGGVYSKTDPSSIHPGCSRPVAIDPGTAWPGTGVFSSGRPNVWVYAFGIQGGLKAAWDLGSELTKGLWDKGWLFAPCTSYSMSAGAVSGQEPP